ncbi:MAG: hypothetical protein JWM89_3507 [Acidimicrobiales bacterium]|nr:hypothetical protein [Acidimicrobiales bacterium]
MPNSADPVRSQRVGGRGQTRTAPFDLAAFADTYEPRDQQRWSEVQATVRECVGRSGVVAYPSAHRLTRALTGLAVHCVEQGVPLDVERMLHPDRVEAFIASLGELKARSDWRADLYRLGRKLTKKAPYRPKLEVGRRPPHEPYTDDELAALRRVISNQGTPHRVQSGIGLFLLGLGAGLDGRWAPFIRPDQVWRTSGGVVVVQAEAPHARRVPVDPLVADDLIAMAERTRTDCLVGAYSTSSNRAYQLVNAIQVPQGLPELSLRRLRSTWIARQLIVGMPVPHLIDAGGLETTARLAEMLPYVRRAIGLPEWATERRP